MFKLLQLTALELDQKVMSSYLAKQISHELENATAQVDDMYGNDIWITYRLISLLLEFENRQAGLGLTHVQDNAFIPVSVHEFFVVF